MFFAALSSLSTKKNTTGCCFRVCETLLCRWRVLGHLAAVLIAAPETSLLHTLRSMMLEIPGGILHGGRCVGKMGEFKKTEGVFENHGKKYETLK